MDAQNAHTQMLTDILEFALTVFTPQEVGYIGYNLVRSSLVPFIHEQLADTATCVALLQPHTSM